MRIFEISFYDFDLNNKIYGYRNKEILSETYELIFFKLFLKYFWFEFKEKFNCFFKSDCFFKGVNIFF